MTNGNNKRSEPTFEISADLCIIGGGMAGVCAAITAARVGMRVALIQDRSILGGNTSSEVRIWALGATSHMGNNNRWAMEGGVIQELFLENLWRNKEGNPILWDALLFEKVNAENNIDLLLNTSVFEVEKSDDETIASVKAFNAYVGAFYNIKAPLFMDASGDGTIAFMAGAEFRIGAESSAEYGEKYAPEHPTKNVLGSTVMFATRDVGHTVKFVAPKFSLPREEVEKISSFRKIDLKSELKYWWIEYGGNLDTIKDAEKIKQELWKVVYGIWDYIKNSGKFPESENLTLEWVAPIAGKRESRRFCGGYTLIQQDVIEQRVHCDDVSYGGWALDHHPVEGLFAESPACVQWHSKGVYPIPYSTMYSRNVKNLFLGGRIISSSHVAYGSTRVMATCAHNAQAVAVAASICIKENILPAQVAEAKYIKELQTRLLDLGQYIPHIHYKTDIAQSAKVSASSTTAISLIEPCATSKKLDCPWAMMLPLASGKVPTVSYMLDVADDTSLKYQLRVSSKIQNHTPDIILQEKEIALKSGRGQWIDLSFDALLEAPQYAFICLMANDKISVRQSDELYAGILAVGQQYDPKVANSALQSPDADIGVDTFEFWLPKRRPCGKLFALKVNPPLKCFEAQNVLNGFQRPISSANAWVADKFDDAATLSLKWDTPQNISEIRITFDADYDHPLENIIMGHPENAVPYCVRNFVVRDGEGNVLAEENDWHLALKVIKLQSPITTNSIKIECTSTWGAPAAIFDVRCY